MKLNRQNESKAQGRNLTDMWEILSPVLCCILEEAIEKWRERESKQLCEIWDIAGKLALEKPEGIESKQLCEIWDIAWKQTLEKPEGIEKQAVV